ncbi:hypothetical protein [Streptomyces sp. NPDC097619]|uniref:hypothetical protein n=1 Tax=Streptomyces sp. NPDC097619 TaxID=3157228 RepID=UPI003328E12B
MDSERKATAPPPPGFVCRTCGQPVQAVVERHKTMGVYVPTWTAGPCHHPDCGRYVPEQVPVTSVRGAVWKELTGWSPDR